MPTIRTSRAALLMAAGLIPLAPAYGAGCPGPAAKPVTIGTVVDVPAGEAARFSFDLAAGEGVIVDLSSVAAPTAAASDGDDHDHEAEAAAGEAAAPARTFLLCDAKGTLLTPQPGEVFAKGGSVSTTPDGQRLRFLAPANGEYVIAVAKDEGARDLLVRRRDLGSAQRPVIEGTLGQPQTGIVSSNAPVVVSFAAKAGQWVELKSTSERDTVLRLAGPDRAGDYSQIAENDDTDGLNPVIRRRLTTAGIYYVQVDALSEEPGEFTLALKAVEAPKPPAPPAPLRLGNTVNGRLADGDAIALYALSVVAGHNYRLELDAPYDGVVSVGLPNPVEPEDGGTGPDAGYADVKSQDAGTTGVERLNFTARSTGQLLVRVKSFGIGETDGGYKLTATDMGG